MSTYTIHMYDQPLSLQDCLPICPEVQAAALSVLLDALGIGVAPALVGAAYGGAVALAFAERYPDRLDSVLVLSMAARPAPMASALRALQRDLLRLGEDLGFQAEAVAMARAQLGRASCRERVCQYV